VNYLKSGLKAKSGDIFFTIFSGHGCYVLDKTESMNQKVKTRDKYVVWDGINEEPFTDDTTWHDCMISVDMELISVQKLRREMFTANVVPTMVFACKRNQASIVKRFDGEFKSVFSHFWLDIVNRIPMVTFRDAICLVNIAMQQEEVEQRAEVVCRIDILDMPVMEASLPDKAHMIHILDMCRTESDKGNRKI
jgi:hypothetical protein